MQWNSQSHIMRLSSVRLQPTSVWSFTERLHWILNQCLNTQLFSVVLTGVCYFTLWRSVLRYVFLPRFSVISTCRKHLFLEVGESFLYLSSMQVEHFISEELYLECKTACPHSLEPSEHTLQLLLVYHHALYSEDSLFYVLTVIDTMIWRSTVPPNALIQPGISLVVGLLLSYSHFMTAVCTQHFYQCILR